MKVIVENLACEYEDQGHGPVVLMLHGWKDSLHSFDELMPGLLRDFRVIRVDLPGFGGSELPHESWDVLKYAEFVKTFIEKMHLDVDILIGHSLGGRIAIKGVGLEVLRPKKLVLIAAAGIAHNKSTRSKLFKVVAKIGKIPALILPSSLRQSLRRKLYQKAGSDYLGAGELTKSYLKIISEDLQTFGAMIHIPTLLIWGKNDTAAPLEDGAKWNKVIFGSDFVVLDGGHFIHQEKSQEVVEEIKSFSAKS